jgi:hypothetical protein
MSGAFSQLAANRLLDQCIQCEFLFTFCSYFRDVLVMLLMAGNCFAVYLVWLSAPASSVRDATESVSSDPSLDDPDAPYLAFLESVDGVMAVPTSPTVTYTPGGSGIVLDHSAPASIKLQSTAT